MYILVAIHFNHLYFEGDAAVGEGVNRHVLSMAMQKLKTGFNINIGWYVGAHVDTLTERFGV